MVKSFVHVVVLCRPLQMSSPTTRLISLRSNYEMSQMLVSFPVVIRCVPSGLKAT
jgi:hypothetical protein